MRETFSLIVAGYGGQGVLTLAEIIGKSALREGFDVKQSEVHGLAQRGGPLQCHVRFGKKVHSPLVRKAGANLIIALDGLEALRACYYASEKRTTVLTDSEILDPNPIAKAKIEMRRIVKKISEFARAVKVVDASKITKSLTGETAMANIFMLGYTIKKKLLPIKKENAWQAISERIRPQFLEPNRRVFEEAFK